MASGTSSSRLPYGTPLFPDTTRHAAEQRRNGRERIRRGTAASRHATELAGNRRHEVRHRRERARRTGTGRAAECAGQRPERRRAEPRQHAAERAGRARATRRTVLHGGDGSAREAHDHPGNRRDAVRAVVVDESARVRDGIAERADDRPHRTDGRLRRNGAHPRARLRKRGADLPEQTGHRLTEARGRPDLLRCLPGRDDERRDDRTERLRDLLDGTRRQRRADRVAGRAESAGHGIEHRADGRRHRRERRQRPRAECADGLRKARDRIRGRADHFAEASDRRTDRIGRRTGLAESVAERIGRGARNRADARDRVACAARHGISEYRQRHRADGRADADRERAGGAHDAARAGRAAGAPAPVRRVAAGRVAGDGCAAGARGGGAGRRGDAGAAAGGQHAGRGEQRRGRDDAGSIHGGLLAVRAMECSIEDRTGNSIFHAIAPRAHAFPPPRQHPRTRASARPAIAIDTFRPPSGAVFVTFVLRMPRCYVTPAERRAAFRSAPPTIHSTKPGGTARVPPGFVPLARKPLP